MLAGVVPGADRTDFWPLDPAPETFLLLEQAMFGADEVPHVGLLSAGRFEQLHGSRTISDPGFLCDPVGNLALGFGTMCAKNA